MLPAVPGRAAGLFLCLRPLAFAGSRSGGTHKLLRRGRRFLRPAPQRGTKTTPPIRHADAWPNRQYFPVVGSRDHSLPSGKPTETDGTTVPARARPKMGTSVTKVHRKGDSGKQESDSLPQKRHGRQGHGQAVRRSLKVSVWQSLGYGQRLFSFKKARQVPSWQRRLELVAGTRTHSWAIFGDLSSPRRPKWNAATAI